MEESSPICSERLEEEVVEGLQKDVVPERTISASSGVVCGSFYARDTAATYVVHWDNTYSWFRPKHIAYDVKISRVHVSESNAAQTDAFGSVDEFVARPGDVDGGNTCQSNTHGDFSFHPPSPVPATSKSAPQRTSLLSRLNRVNRSR